MRTVLDSHPNRVFRLITFYGLANYEDVFTDVFAGRVLFLDITPIGCFILEPNRAL